MPIRLVVAVTDRGWFDHLRRRPDLAEVNFWAPSEFSFKALRPGELFLFKLRAPVDRIVGGGVFAYATTLPCSLAWEAFGEANGAASLPAMRQRIAGLSQATPSAAASTHSPFRDRTMDFPPFRRPPERGGRRWWTMNPRPVIGFPVMLVAVKHRPSPSSGSGRGDKEHGPDRAVVVSPLSDSLSRSRLRGTSRLLG